MILCIETASTNCSVALSSPEGAIVLKEDNSQSFSHGERLHSYIGEIMEQQGVGFADLQAIAVSKGPGSYTGLRIGVSAAKGLCFANNLPLISVPTLTVLAHKVAEPKGQIVAMMDARRMEVYSAVFDADYQQLRDTQAEILDETSFVEYLQRGPVTFIGSGVEKFAAICNHPNANFIPEVLPSAQQMAPLAQEKLKKATFEDVAYFEPYYLKDFKLG